MKIDRVLAPNPGPFTGPGTNTWLLRDGGRALVIDPGPRDDRHASAIRGQVGDGEVCAVLVTHTHEDHAPLANPLASDLGVPAYGHRPGPDFDPDVRLDDGAKIPVGGLEVEVVHTPGHADDHLCFLAGRVLFTGDHIMGGSSVMVEKMVPYLRSLDKIRRLDIDTLYPGHGEVIEEAHRVVDWYAAHRREREGQVVDAIRGGARSVGDIVEVVYRHVDSALHPLAARSVMAHVDKLVEEGVVVRKGRELQLVGDESG